MEGMELSHLFGGIYKGKKVLVTGHTGFKGSWLVLWLEAMGAKVYGISLEAETHPNHISLINFKGQSYIQDINDTAALREKIESIEPEIVFHLAAQALVRRSYDQPVETFLTNIIGTANVLDACKNLPSLRAIVVITTDKCYENREWLWPYRENDPLGGKDPYSASKACAEIVAASYRHSFYTSSSSVLLATARAGNVIGGGDWAQDRIIPDLVRAAESGKPLQLRYPQATRPWQHVLEPLSGYLMLGWKLLEGENDFATAWNFGPDASSNVAVIDLVKTSLDLWPSVKYEFLEQDQPHEANLLMLDSSKAGKLLQWRNVWSFGEVVKHTIQWYKNYYDSKKINSTEDLKDYVASARSQSLIWTTK